MKNSMLTMGLAALLFAACSNDVTDEATQTQNDGNRYMAISLVAGGNTRADAAYEDGTEDEYAANQDSIYFFFFDNAGNAVSVDKKTGVNFVKPSGSVTWSSSSAESETVLSSVIAVLNTENGEMPSQVVAVINKTTAPTAAVSLADLKAEIINVGGGISEKGLFLMSNSVYNDGQDNVYATPLTTANFASSETLASQNPVKIYVERVVAKVTMTTDGTAIKLEDSDDYTSAYANGMYVKINGWQLFNTAKTTPLLKNIESISLTDFAWNDASLYRSFWANTTGVELEKVDDVTWNKVSKSTATEYPFENTLENVNDGDDNHTSVVIAATLCDAKGNPQDIARWLSKYYTVEGLKTAVASYLSNDVYSLTTTDDGNTWASITSEDITLALAGEDNAYDVQPGINTEKKWYAKNSETELTTEQLATIVEKVPLARVWTNGQTYYFAEITHTNGAAAVVRNHVYKLSVNSITGLGTPVFNGDTAFDPIRPTGDDEWYLDAQLYVQAWKIVNNSLDLVTTK